MQVTVYGPLRSATGEKTVTLDAEPETVGEAIEAFVEAYPRARSQLYAEDGTLRPSVRVMADGERATHDDPCRPDTEVAVFPAMQGGRR